MGSDFLCHVIRCFQTFAYILSNTMDDTLAQVAKHCAIQLEVYQRCVESNPDNWDTACIQQKHALTKCSENNVGIIKFVKQRCESEITAYDRCLSSNSTEPEKCINTLRDLYTCTEATASAYKEQHQNNKESKLPNQSTNTTAVHAPDS